MSGILTAFFDFLTYPMVTLGIPLIMYLEGINQQRCGEKFLYGKAIFSHSISWGIGYVGMWAGKWVVATCFTDENIILNAFDQIRIRSSNINKEETYSWLSTVMKNVDVWNKTVLLAVFCVLVFGTVLYRLKMRTWIRKVSLCRIAAIGAVSAYPFIWYFFTMNHSSIHGWFMTWRELAISVFGIVTILCLDMQKQSKL